MDTASAAISLRTPAPAPRDLLKSLGLITAVVALFAIMWMPKPPDLPAAGQVMLAILAFAVIVWMTEALDYAASAV